MFELFQQFILKFYFLKTIIHMYRLLIRYCIKHAFKFENNAITIYQNWANHSFLIFII